MPSNAHVMSPEIVNAVYDALVEHVGANENRRDEFVYHQTRAYLSEYRFCGSLGFGGKFWRNSGFRADGTYGEVWYVNAYAEDMTRVREKAIAAADAALMALLATHENQSAQTRPVD